MPLKALDHTQDSLFKEAYYFLCHFPISRERERESNRCKDQSALAFSWSTIKFDARSRVSSHSLSLSLSLLSQPFIRPERRHQITFLHFCLFVRLLSVLSLTHTSFLSLSLSLSICLSFILYLSLSLSFYISLCLLCSFLFAPFK